MPEIPRLNGVIRALEQGKTAFVGFAPADVETATALAGSSFDGVAFEMENRILKICQEPDVPCGHPHPDAKNIERLIASGYRFLMPGAPRSFAVLEQGRNLAGR